MKFTINSNQKSDQTTNEEKAIRIAKKFTREGETNVYIECYRASDGQTMYLNPDGYSIGGRRWD